MRWATEDDGWGMTGIMMMTTTMTMTRIATMPVPDDATTEVEKIRGKEEKRRQEQSADGRVCGRWTTRSKVLAGPGLLGEHKNELEHEA